MNNIEKSIEIFQKAIEINPDFFPPIYYALGVNQFSLGRYEAALENFKKFLSYEQQKSSLIRKAEHGIENCKFAIWAIKHPVPFKPINLGDSINTKYYEYLPTLTADDKKMIITRRMPLTPEYENSEKDWTEVFYESDFKNGAWTKAKPIPRPLNSFRKGNHRGTPCYTPDGQYLYFAMDMFDGKGQDIYFSRKIGEQWSEPVNAGEQLNSKAWDTNPSISSDGKTMYFISTREGGYGGADIWKSTLQDDGKWGKPENLGNVINTDGNEYDVRIHPDNQTLYFSSDGHPGMGGTDFFYSRKNEKGEWTKPVNLGYPINSNKDDRSLIINSKGDIAIFSSDREGGKGKTDLYSFELYPEAQPQKITYVSGIVFDKISTKKLEAKFELIDLSTGKTVIESLSNPGDGSFLVCLPTNKNYALNVSCNGYLFYSENFALQGIREIQEPYKINIPMQPILIGSTVVLKNIFFETNSFQLKEESKVELMKLKEFLSKNPKLKIEISGHTDNIGNDNNNQILSENRAKAVLEFLVENGIDKNRLLAKGYGKTMPIDNNDSSEGRANNRRTEFKIIANE
jgi:outer membrane protein OmpA-like peptidoglycan-associated protein/tetratricopeptide (TPR) repeat protein